MMRSSNWTEAYPGQRWASAMLCRALVRSWALLCTSCATPALPAHHVMVSDKNGHLHTSTARYRAEHVAVQQVLHHAHPAAGAAVQPHHLSRPRDAVPGVADGRAVVPGCCGANKLPGAASGPRGSASLQGNPTAGVRCTAAAGRSLIMWSCSTRTQLNPYSLATFLADTAWEVCAAACWDMACGSSVRRSRRDGESSPCHLHSAVLLNELPRPI